MARTFRRPRQSHPIAEMNVTNLIDLGFTLLIIFMIATPLINQEQTIPVNLPVGVEEPAGEGRQEHALRGDLGRRAGATTTSTSSTTPVGAAPSCAAGCRLYGAETKPPVIRIRGDAQVPYEKIVQLMDELKKANLLKFTFDTQTGSK